MLLTLKSEIKMFNILFVCTGNTCRSPMAAALLEEELAKNPPPFQVAVTSAGLLAFPGEKIAEEARKALAGVGISSLAHRRSAQLERAMVQEADLILVMTQNHLHQLLASFPGAKNKAFQLAQYLGCLEGADIEDPLGQGQEKYQQVLQDMLGCLKNLTSKLKGAS